MQINELPKKKHFTRSEQHSKKSLLLLLFVLMPRGPMALRLGPMVIYNGYGIVPKSMNGAYMLLYTLS